MEQFTAASFESVQTELVLENEIKLETVNNVIENEIFQHNEDDNIPNQHLLQKEIETIFIKEELGNPEFSSPLSSSAKPHKCSICLTEFDNLVQLRSHQLLHISQDALKCNICVETFIDHGNFPRHYPNHAKNQSPGTKENVFKRNICKKTFSDKLEHIHAKNGNSYTFCKENESTEIVKSDKICKNGKLLQEKSVQLEQKSTDTQPTVLKAPQLVLLLRPVSVVNNNTKKNSCNNGQSIPTTYAFPKNIAQPGIKYAIFRNENSPKVLSGKSNCNIQTSPTFTYSVIKNDNCNVSNSKIEEVKTYKCKECNKEFDDNEALEEHELFHIVALAKKHSYKCDICKSQYSRKTTLYHHMLEHIAMPFYCLICKTMFAEQSLYENHLNGHSKDVAVAQKRRKRGDPKSEMQCPHCFKTYRKAGAFEDHIKSHIVKKFICHHCGKACRSKTNLVNHVETHNEQKNYNCDVCNEKFRSYSWLYRHKKVKHCSSKEKYKCSICDKVFLNVYTLNHHRKIHKDDIEEMCESCGRIFKHSYSLKRHIALNHDENAEKNRERERELWRARVKKTKTYECNICQKKYNAFSSLRVHQRTKHEERKMICHICQKSFHFSRGLKAHMKTHTRALNTVATAEKPHQCHICHRCYTYKCTLKLHMKSHETRNFSCNFCHQSFFYKQILQRHLHNAHYNQMQESI